MARIKAVLRRQGDLPHDVPEFSFGDTHVDFRRAEVTRGGKPVRLLVRELEVLKYLIAHEGQVVTREDLLDKVWGYEEFPTTRTVDNYILSLRKKLEPVPGSPAHILTVYTAGYKFVR
jgi:two-component system alkaline phosphatase synthesis response regulator PhoP